MYALGSTYGHDDDKLTGNVTVQLDDDGGLHDSIGKGLNDSS